MKHLYFSLLAIVTFTFANAQNVNIPDEYFLATLLSAGPNTQIASTEAPVYNSVSETWIVSSYNVVDTSGDGLIQITEAQAIKFLSISYGSITNTTGIEAFTNLHVLNCDNNGITSLDVSNIPNLKVLTCTNNQLTNLDISNVPNLDVLDCGGNYITNLDFSNVEDLRFLYCGGNSLTNLDVSNFPNLRFLYCGANLISNIEFTNMPNLRILYCANNLLTNLNVSNLPNLQELYCSLNLITNLDVSNLFNLQYLECYDNQIINLNITNLTNLIVINCDNNQINTLEVSNLPNLGLLKCEGNQLTDLNISNFPNLEHLFCNSNQINNLVVSNLPILNNLLCGLNQLTILDVSNIPSLFYLDCYNNQLTSLNLSNQTNLHYINCSYNLLTSLNIKNNSTPLDTLDFSDNPNLQFICADDDDTLFVQDMINEYGLTNCHVNSYCSFTPGGIFYTIQGNNKLDFDVNGCDANDLFYKNLKFNITDGTNSGTFISDELGSYSFPVSAGTHTITPQLENSSYFIVSPTTSTLSFPETASPYIQDFCITANGVHHDLETVLIPITPARPGFDANYKIKYKNVGNQVENAFLKLYYNDLVLDLVSTSVVPTSQNTGEINWNLGTLIPFQEGEILVTLNLNSPMENPPLNGGDELGFNALITPIDDNYPNNQSSLKQVVVNSYDPNDKRCLEGNTINTSMIGEFIHYMIRFENTGTFAAQNIVVKDLIDVAKFDVSTLQMNDASHTCFTRINGNKVEFIFENINLPFDDANNDGYVVFKIKTLPTLTVNSTISNTAEIYFDYNFPIVTNTETSTFLTLQNNDFDFSSHFTIYPNPAKNNLNITSNHDIEISSISIYNSLGQLVLVTTKPNQNLDVSGLKTGTYVISIKSNKGISSSKFLKE